jgi:hypothetical protein
MIRTDASEYSEKHSISRLILQVMSDTTPEGDCVRRKPYSIVLIDEIEKACREFVTLFLQVLDDGRLTDGQGCVVDRRNTVIMMMSTFRRTSFTRDECLCPERHSSSFASRIHQHRRHCEGTASMDVDDENCDTDVQIEEMEWKGLLSPAINYILGVLCMKSRWYSILYPTNNVCFRLLLSKTQRKQDLRPKKEIFSCTTYHIDDGRCPIICSELPARC